MASPPPSTKTSPSQRLRARALRHRHLAGGEALPPCRLRYGGCASSWGFAIYRASHDDYQDSILPGGQFARTPEDALDCACGLYLGDPAAWLAGPSPD